MKKVIYSLFLVAGGMLAACGGGEKKGAGGAVVSDDSPDVDSAVTDVLFSEPDSTVYAKADGFGMSGCTLVDSAGTFLELGLSNPAATADEAPAKIFGTKQDTARYAVTLTPDGENVLRMINVSQLERFTKDYRIHNARLYLKDDKGDFVEVEILQLDNKAFRAKDAAGKEYSFKS